MAVDEVILEAATAGNAPPTLRLYAWEPACLSLGYAQPFSDVDLPALHAHGWDLVRRPTGGRAILHTDELTYSVSGPQRDPRLAGGVLASYRAISTALLLALQHLGLPAHADSLPGAAGNEANGGTNPVCFEAPSNYEITVGGKKLVGSAQRRRGEGVLQHGSLPLTGDLTRITNALVFDDEASRQKAAERLLQRATTVETALHRPVSWEQAAQALSSAFAEALNLELAPGELTPAELIRAKELVAGRFANSAWTERV